MKAIIVLLAGFGLASTGPGLAGETEVEHFSAHPDMQLPFSDAVRVGNMLYLSGKIGNIPGTRNLAEGGITGQTRQALENIKASLEKHGSSMDEVVKCTVFLADIAEWGAMNEVYMEFFPENKPARTAVGINLSGDTRVEIECIAAA